MRTLTFALDFDGTLAADPDLFQEFLRLLRSNGHHAVLVTQRTPEFRRDVEALIQGWDLPVVYAGGEYEARSRAEGRVQPGHLERRQPGLGGPGPNLRRRVGAPLS